MYINSNDMATLQDTTCCGLDEIEGLEGSPEETLLHVCEEKYDIGWGDGAKHAFLMFTDTTKSGRGKQLAEYIEKHGLGYVDKTRKARRNPNTGNYVSVWIWSPNEKALKKWWKKESMHK